MTIGDTVFVRWYGKILEGMIVENGEVNPMLASMVVVRVPVQGVKTQALFMPHHVYPNAELAAMKEGVKLVPTEMPTVVPTETATETPSSNNKSRHSGRHNEAWKRLQEFKEANWDHERNHIKLRALNDFYDLWKEWVTGSHPEADAYNGGPKPDAYKQAVSDEKMEELKSQLKKYIAPVEPVKKSNLDGLIEIWKKESRSRKTVKVTQLALWE